MACRGIHDRYKTKKQGPYSENGGPTGLYKKGLKRCRPCEVYFDPKELEKQNLSPIRCPCCRKPLKSRPNNRRFRNNLEMKVVI